jgi:hypothetical protein
MLFAVVQHVAALAESLQISRPVVAWIMIEVGGCQKNLGRPDSFIVWRGGLCWQA